MELIKADKITKKYSGNTVLNNISFSVNKGEFFHILGENGSGKTTLMRVILGLTEVSSGEITYSNMRKNEIGYLPQLSDIQPDFPANVSEVVLSGFLNRKIILPFFTAEQKSKAVEIMEKLHIAEFKNKPFATLSGGQRQRVLLARALCASSGVLLLDEPLTALDPVAAAGFFEILDDLKAQGYTLIMISHDIHCAIKYADKILHLGKKEVFYGDAKDYPNSHLGKHMLEEGHHHND